MSFTQPSIQGRPKAGPEDKFRLLPVQKRLAELLGMQVKYAMDCIGDEAKNVAAELKNGEVRHWCVCLKKAMVWGGGEGEE